MNSPIRPIPLGLLTPVSGTPLQLTANFVTLYGAANPGVGGGPANNLQDCYFQRADFRNVGGSTIYIGLQNLNRATLAGVCWIIPPGGGFTFQHPTASQPYHLGDYWVDADAGGGALTGSVDWT